MPNASLNVSIIGAGSTYGIFLVKWALQLKHFPDSNREKIAFPAIGKISYSNTNERNRDLVTEVLLDDLSHMPSFADKDGKKFWRTSTAISTGGRWSIRKTPASWWSAPRSTRTSLI